VLLELTVAEQRFNAVMEVIRDGLTVIEVAERYRVSRQTVHGWLRRYAAVRRGLALVTPVGRASHAAACRWQPSAAWANPMTEARSLVNWPPGWTDWPRIA
jgi:hypothetical protein